MKNLFLISIFSLLLFNCASSETPAPDSSAEPRKEAIIITERNEYEVQSSEREKYNEQISCHEKDCSVLSYENFSELEEKIAEKMEENAGKFLIRVNTYSRKKLSDPELENVLVYLREITKREGKVSIEPYYKAERSASSLGFSFVKDSVLVTYNIYSRIRDSIKYRHTKNYHAKVILNPKHHNVMLIYFVHRQFGDVCSSVFSNCREVEYVDDDTFDMSLSTALKESAKDRKPVQVRFTQSKAKIFEAKLDWDHLMAMKDSARMYKWLVLSKKTEQKPIKRDRMLGIEVVITILDYSLTVYDKLKEYKMYSPVFEANAEVAYTGTSPEGDIKSVTFTYE
ncbi:MAG TPA: hypothetical protein PL048_04980 [Leptospiraceae bacterium]|nr:hypothetical protein [Leptospiraceae bacterium]HMY65433.1 hypothetical protein [Leptospiraceae bacterium]HMZ58103.1 hypothetical protein [Leptospiraceae bacterium]HNF15756.1 hypothetical protein [Leptospiraceae bacterium]HNF24000.1 hypothetical protein [Leptospiraceae bacterium]